MNPPRKLKVTLAGYNLDADIIGKWADLLDAHRQGALTAPELEAALDALSAEPLTPETLSAAYARISRSPVPVGELRRDARASVNRARQSNERIVFGLGHASVAEHAVFNLDVVNASRLALEELESHRLASYTEASQRYISLEGDFILPGEIERAGAESSFIELCGHLFTAYSRLINLLKERRLDLPERERDNFARQDARYVLPLAVVGQVGVTVNARTAEYVIRTCLGSKLEEVRELGKQLHDALRRIVPSLIRYTEPSTTAAELPAIDSPGRVGSSEFDDARKNDSSDNPVRLITYPDFDEQLALAAMLFKLGEGAFETCRMKVAAMSPQERRRWVIQAVSHLNAFDPPPREFELGYFVFEVTLSAAAFAQLKRHRLASLIKQPYRPELGVTLPPSIRDAGADSLFWECIERSEIRHREVRRSNVSDPDWVAAYVLTNAHRRRVLFQANARELIQFSRLREDLHAQWDLRGLAADMLRVARKVCPTLLAFAAGKDHFERMKSQLVAELQGKGS